MYKLFLSVFKSEALFFIKMIVWLHKTDKVKILYNRVQGNQILHIASIHHPAGNVHKRTSPFLYMTPYRPKSRSRETWIKTTPITLAFWKAFWQKKYATLLFKYPFLTRLRDILRQDGPEYNPDIWYLSATIYCALTAETMGLPSRTWD